jgi:xanthine dehydrogenase accessory factor
MSTRKLIETFSEWRRSGRPMVLATVYETTGSTYSKAGHHILIAGNGEFQGLVSGGCLEGDLAERAAEVIETGRARTVTYDLRDEADEIWGLGIGCNGLIRVLLQPLVEAQRYEPFASISRLAQGNEPAVVATVIESGAERWAPGSTLVWRPSSGVEYASLEEAGQPIFAACRNVASKGLTELRVEPSGLRILYAPVRRVPIMLVLGAGLDAVPLVDMAVDIGWRISVADHRPAYLERDDFDRADEVLLVDPRSLADHVDLERFDAVLVMSHHLETDRAYLAQLADIDLGYVGVLGPPARRERLLTELGAMCASLRERLRGPVGLDIGADSPETIALSILAEIQMTMSGP